MHWQDYRFPSPSRPDPAISALPFDVDYESNRVTLMANLPLSMVGFPARPPPPVEPQARGGARP